MSADVDVFLKNGKEFNLKRVFKDNKYNDNDRLVVFTKGYGDNVSKAWCFNIDEISYIDFYNIYNNY